MKLITGQNLNINITSDEARAHFNNPRNYTKEILEQFDNSLYKDFIKGKDLTILDIGANVGLFALHVLPLAKKIVCVEPTPEHFAIQKEILQSPKVVHENSALSHYTGETDFYWCGVNTTMNSLHNRGDRSFKVPCITLTDLCVKHLLTKVDFCKIDIEGSEWTAITKETLTPVFDIIDKIFIELHPPTAESQDAFKALFESVGYKVDKYIHDSLFCYK